VVWSLIVDDERPMQKVGSGGQTIYDSHGKKEHAGFAHAG
jgi:hypothetical protein